MSSRRKAASVAFTGAAALTAVGFTAGHAHAAGVSKVTVNPAGPYSAVNVGTSPYIHDVQTRETVGCTSARAKGSLPGDATGNSVGTVTSATFNNCDLLTIPYKMVLKKTATLVAASPTTTSGITKGSLTGISATITGTGLLFCHAVLSGTLPSKYNNNTHQLTIDSAKTAGLTVKSASGCMGGFVAGNSAYFNVVYSLSTSPTITAT